MSANQKTIALIPARGGSKGILKKNIRPLGGVPLLAYSIAAGLQSRHVERVIVSTDSAEIAEIALEWGAEVPFLRPAELAEDATTDFPVFEHAVRWLEENEGYRADIVVQLRPTSPFRPPGLVDEAIEALVQNLQADSVRCITPSGQNPFKMWRIENRRLQPLLQLDLPEPYNQPRQVLPDTFWQTGHVEAIRYETIIEKKSLTGDVILPCLVPAEYAIDLDNLYQWDYAEHVLAKWDLKLVAQPVCEGSPNPLKAMKKSPETQTNPFNVNTLLRRLLPIICVGVVANLAFSWYMADRSRTPDWSQFSAKYLLMAAVLAVLPWFWHCVRLAIWGRFLG